MSSSARILAVVATLVILVVAFVVLSPGGDDETTPSRTQAATTSTTPATSTTTAPRPRAEPQPQPRYDKIRIRAGKPVGGVKRITLAKGDRARIEISSPDTSDEIHVHGYDLTEDLKAGGRARLAFDADAEGIFEIELHGSGAQVAELAVQPR